MSVFCPVINLATGECRGEFASHERAVHPSGLTVFFLGSLRGRPQGSPGLSDAAYVAEQLAGHGWDCVEKFNGAFLLGAYDARDRRFRLFRDQLGQSQVIYTTLPEQQLLIFGDSVKAVRAAMLANGGESLVDREVLAEYFRMGYVSCGNTVYQGIARVPAAHCAVIYPDGSGELRRYWHPHFNGGEKTGLDEAVEECRRLLKTSIRRCLDACPDADYMLSGGIDSGVVMGMASEFFPEGSRQAHTIAVADGDYDESSLAAGTASRCGVPLQRLLLDAQSIDRLPALIANAGEPFADSSLLPTYLACASTGRPALITGDGGDELFGGYRRYQAMLWRGRIPHWLDCLARPFAGVVSAMLPDGANSRCRMATAKRALAALSKPYLEAYAGFQAVATREQLQRLIPGCFWETPVDSWEMADGATETAAGNANTLMRRCNNLDLAFYLPDDGFRKTAIAAAASGKKLLSPLLDLEVANFALGLPDSLRITTKCNKVVLRTIGRRYLDPRILSMRKRGFGIPIAQWFRNALSGRIAELAGSIGKWDKYNLLDEKHARQLAEEHRRGRRDHSALLWALWCYWLWIENEDRR